MAKFNRKVREIKDMISQAKYGTEGLKLCLASFITQPDSFSSRHENLCSVIMNTCLHSARKWHRNLSDMWRPSTFKIGLREITILMCEQKVYPIRLHVNGRNDSQHCWPTMLGVVASVCIFMLLKVWPVSNFAQQLPKPATACKRVCKPPPADEEPQGVIFLRGIWRHIKEFGIEGQIPRISSPVKLEKRC